MQRRCRWSPRDSPTPRCPPAAHPRVTHPERGQAPAARTIRAIPARAPRLCVGGSGWPRTGRRSTRSGARPLEPVTRAPAPRSGRARLTLAAGSDPIAANRRTHRGTRLARSHARGDPARTRREASAGASGRRRRRQGDVGPRPARAGPRPRLGGVRRARDGLAVHASAAAREADVPADTRLPVCSWTAAASRARRRSHAEWRSPAGGRGGPPGATRATPRPGGGP